LIIINFLIINWQAGGKLQWERLSWHIGLFDCCLLIIREGLMNKDIELDQSLGYKEAGLDSYLIRCF
jgi:hypothetical protein